MRNFGFVGGIHAPGDDLPLWFPDCVRWQMFRIDVWDQRLGGVEKIRVQDLGCMFEVWDQRLGGVEKIRGTSGVCRLGVGNVRESASRAIKMERT